MILRRLLFHITVPLGFLCLAFGLITLSKRFGFVDYSFTDYNVPSAISTDIPLPTRISIKGLEIDVAIDNKAIDSGHWPTSDSTAIYLSGSGEVGQTGNAVIYAHNWPTLFGNLIKIKPEDEIEIELTNGKIITFTTERIAIVTPDQTHILDRTSDRRLTLYTCTGFFDRRRLIIVAIAKT